MVMSKFDGGDLQIRGAKKRRKSMRVFGRAPVWSGRLCCCRAARVSPGRICAAVRHCLPPNKSGFLVRLAAVQLVRASRPPVSSVVVAHGSAAATGHGHAIWPSPGAGHATFPAQNRLWAPAAVATSPRIGGRRAVRSVQSDKDAVSTTFSVDCIRSIKGGRRHLVRTLASTRSRISRA